MPKRTWVSPTGELHDVADDELYRFCTAHQLTFRNMLDHIDSASSDQKNGGWRLLDRLRFIGHVNLPDENVPALGTLDAFYDSCKRAADGRNVLDKKNTLGKLLAGTYNGGKPWKCWQLRHLNAAQKRQALQQWLGRSAIVTQPMVMAPPRHGQQPSMMPILPDYVRAQPV